MKAVLAALAHHDMRGGNGIFPSQESLAWETELSLSTVRRAVKRLERAGWIVRFKRYLGGRRTSDRYIIQQAETASPVLPEPSWDAATLPVTMTGRLPVTMTG